VGIHLAFKPGRDLRQREGPCRNQLTNDREALQQALARFCLARRASPARTLGPLSKSTSDCGYPELSRGAFRQHERKPGAVMIAPAIRLPASRGENVDREGVACGLSQSEVDAVVHQTMTGSGRRERVDRAWHAMCRVVAGDTAPGMREMRTVASFAALDLGKPPRREGCARLRACE